LIITKYSASQSDASESTILNIHHATVRVLRSVDEPLQQLRVLRLPHDLDDRVLGWPAVREGLSKVSQSNQ